MPLRNEVVILVFSNCKMRALTAIPTGVFLFELSMLTHFEGGYDSTTELIDAVAVARLY